MNSLQVQTYEKLWLALLKEGKERNIIANISTQGIRIEKVLRIMVPFLHRFLRPEADSIYTSYSYRLDLNDVNMPNLTLLK